MGRVEAVSLFDVEDIKDQPHVRDMTVDAVPASDVREFARRYHYTQSGGADGWRFGLWHGPTLHGVVTYNPPTLSTAESVFGPEHRSHVWNMGRLILSDDSPRNSESRLVGGSLRAISRDHPTVWAVITYADTSVGHIGTIYQATNAFYIGTGRTTKFYVDETGRRRGAYLDGNTVTSAHANARGWEIRRSAVKHRYLYILGSKRQRKQRLTLLRYPILPYPKASPNAPCAAKPIVVDPKDDGRKRK